jgi:hypothetical protein
MPKKSEYQLKLQALLDLCRDKYGWTRIYIADKLEMGREGFTDHIHVGRSTTKRTYYSVLGLVAEHKARTPDQTTKEAKRLFAKFWKSYPRKEGKRVAEQAFIRAIKRVGGVDNHQIILDGLSTSPRLKRERRFIPHAATWLNGDSWEDEPDPATTEKQRIY